MTVAVIYRINSISGRWNQAVMLDIWTFPFGNVAFYIVSSISHSGVAQSRIKTGFLDYLYWAWQSRVYTEWSEGCR